MANQTLTPQKVYDGTYIDSNFKVAYSASRAREAKFLDTLATYGPADYHTALALQDWAAVLVREQHLLKVGFSIQRR